MSAYSRRKHAKLRPPESFDTTVAVDVERYEPDWHQCCEVCGDAPTVTGLRDGAVVLDTRLCGPCLWGDNRAADPSTWNS